LAEIDRILTEAVKGGASDIHLCSNTVPMVRLWGDIVSMRNYDALSPEKNKERLLEILTNSRGTTSSGISKLTSPTLSRELDVSGRTSTMTTKDYRALFVSCRPSSGPSKSCSCPKLQKG
jgi:Tfp pilus assembly pilus retraction ATPase PilT